MWLAGVRHVALDQHCLRSFGQPDRPRLDISRRHQTIELPEHNPPLAWYLCALPNPWKWSDNAHLAFEGAPGEGWDGPALVSGPVCAPGERSPHHRMGRAQHPRE